MTSQNILQQSFYNRPVLDVARDLLGKRLVRLLEGHRLSGVIVETEAYRGEEDQACHARAGKTPRTAVMYGEPGHAYVYFTYGIHWLLNCVTGESGFPAAVLIRAIIPLEGKEAIAANRAGRPESEWTNGPAKICQAMKINGDFNESMLYTTEANLWIEEGRTILEEQISTGPRVGIDNVPEPWRSKPWRFLAEIPEK